MFPINYPSFDHGEAEIDREIDLGPALEFVGGQDEYQATAANGSQLRLVIWDVTPLLVQVVH